MGDDAAAIPVLGQALELVREARGDVRFNDVNYVFPTFIMTKMPVAIIKAAMPSQSMPIGVSISGSR